MKNRKVTFIICSLAGGGAEAVCVNITHGLAEKGWEVDLVVLNLKNAAYRERISDKVNLVSLNVYNSRNAMLALRRYFRAANANQVVTFNYVITVITVLLRKLTRLKVRIIARNINTISQVRQQEQGIWRKYIVVPMIDKFYGGADHIINQCKAMRDDLISVYPKLSTKTSVIYNPVNPSIVTSASIDNIDQDYILCVGRLEKQKAFHRAIQAFAEVLKSHPSLKLKILGKGSLELSLKQQATELGILDNIDFIGFVSNTKDYYINAKCLWLTSHYEGFPNVVVESLALGTPVVSFDCPSGPSELIQSGKNGFLVENGNIDKFVEATNQCLVKQWNVNEIKQSVSHLQLDAILEQWQVLLSPSKGKSQ